MPKNTTQKITKLLDDKTIRGKFLACISKGLSVITACKRANISVNTYYNYLKDNPDFLDEVEYGKQAYVDEWVEVLTDGLKERDYKFALEVLKALPSDYSHKVNLEIKNDVDEVYKRIAERRQQIKDIKVRDAKK
ncbi:MAG: hypothetical protein OXF77_00860 [Thaumarchaeota archaeon]|nr:hypothetical protein [Nitrososphaerota archaeon]